MAIYAEQLSYRGIFGFFPFIILVFALLAVLRIDVVFDRLVAAAMGVPPNEIPERRSPRTFRPSCLRSRLSRD